MESNFLTAVFLPLNLFIIMLGMGLGLTLDDFKRIFVTPKAVIFGLIAQLIMLPLLGFSLAVIFRLTPDLAVGLMILVACPGGPISNMVTYLAGGNVALSITLTAISSLITVFTIPLVVSLAMQIFMGEGMSLQLTFLKTVIQIAILTLVPVALGMVLRYYLPQPSAKAEKFVKWLSSIFLGLIIFGVFLKERATLPTFFLQVGWVTLTLNISAMVFGYAIASLAKLDKPSTKAIAFEVGIQNGTLAITIASAPIFLNTPSMAIPAGIYSLLMCATGAAFAWCLRSR